MATPKQIRELMKVDGLTNDEVKSHLQVGSNASIFISAPIYLFLDQINTTFPLLIQKYRLHARRMPNSSDAVNRRVAVAGGVWVPEEQYSNSSQQSVSQSGSPQSPLQLAGATPVVSVTAGDSCEEEDGKSESFSWK